MKNLKILNLSTSSMKTYKQCPRRYYLRYVVNVKIPKKEWPHTKFGNFIHNVLEEFHNVTMVDGTVNQKKLMKQACEKFHGEFGIDSEQQVEAIRILKTYLDEMEKNGLPPVLSNEKNFKIQIGEGLTVNGYIDRIDKEGDQFHILDYKGLATDTPIPTANGWTTMGNLKVGDYVLGSNGKPTLVTVKSGIHNRPCYKITFSDKTEVICDNVHLWTVNFASGSKKYKATLDADELFARYKLAEEQGVGTFFVNNPSPLLGEEKELPMNPWLLGAWLGAEDTDLTYMSEVYLRASFKQRLSLLQGLMDSCGLWNPLRCRAVFVTENKNLADLVAELVRTFGVTVKNISCHNKTGIVDYKVEFRPAGFNPFDMLCKADDVEIFLSKNKSKNIGALSRSIRKMEVVESVPTQCIAVDAEDSLYQCGNGMVLTHNTGRSKYLDDFQLLVYGLYLLNEHPELEKYSASYLMLKEGMKKLSYEFTREDLENVLREIKDIANEIRTDETWEPKPHYVLCNYCDFVDICDAAPRKKGGKDLDWS